MAPAQLIRTMRFIRIPEPLRGSALGFEPKYDGFRAIARIDGHRCTLTSRNGHTFKSWPQLCEELAQAFRVYSAVIDGEIVCLDADGLD
jgi:bifunctional non-homologous end joining protein LigD